jgi:hypothetical protein
LRCAWFVPACGRGLKKIPVFCAVESEEAKNCLSQLHIQAQPVIRARRVFLAPMEQQQNTWDFLSALDFFVTFFGNEKK